MNQNGYESNGQHISVANTVALANIDCAIAAISEAVPYIQKTRTPGLSFPTAKIEDMLRLIKPELNKHGITVSPISAEMVVDQVYETDRGTTMRRVMVRVRYEYRHASSGTSRISEALGEASDTSDKATPKAMTAAYKAAMRQTFAIETGETDPDAHPAVASARGEALDTPTRLGAKKHLEQARTQQVLDNVWRMVDQRHSEGAITDEQYAALRVVRDKTQARISRAPVGSK